eukprot:CAMPEP_0201675020 /NCGR_PEP_ID=MMETSP0494-20130426/38508_1 /ASSEMBLY_ACC=CAM_ASM_000839 /TAXON_ID=420259 /ORGANISM="Thalassiosira gravida, Strain GMp14c1" /LENGTH=232 /DNA_ID=CAMNT_0048157319 /DNA_START=93 /DNA_END=791 /DNA_ORIENTATION=+
MAWKDTWADILNGGSPRWKVDNLDAKEKALAHIIEHHHAGGSSPDNCEPMRILCPLAGDDPFVQYAWSKGHDVTAIDIVPDALKAMRSQFGDDVDDWTSENQQKNGLVWKHRSGRATLFEGDILMKRPELVNSFDVIYDKDSFGALSLEMRPKFCERLSEFHKDGGTLYIEVKNKETGREFGPPYHVEKECLMNPTAFGTWFEHKASLGEVYPLKMPGMKQTGHILRRALRR